MGSLGPCILQPEKAVYSRPSAAQAAADAIPILVNGTYHVFHLTTPPFTTHHPPRLRASWSRMQSTDLIDWTRDSEPVLRPGKNASDPDADGVWTGCALLGPDGRMNIFYTGYSLSQGGKQVILRTRSNDCHGTKFESPGTEISISGSGISRFEDIDFRDAYIFWNGAASQYWMLVATRLAQGPHWTRGCIALLTSSNLDNWVIEPEPLYSPNDMFCPECPELFSLPNGKWYLVYSRFHGPNSGTVYRVADKPTGPFRIPRDGSHGRFDGRRWYAAKSCPKADDPAKRVYFGWLGDYVDEEGKWLWGGDLGLPREVSADSNGWLKIDIVHQVREALRQTSLPLRHIAPNLNLTSIGSTATSFPKTDLTRGIHDLLLDFRIGECDAHSFGIILQADGTDNGHKLQFCPDDDGSYYSIALITDKVPLDDFWADQYKLYNQRSVDGPELVRHERVRLGVNGVSVFLRGQLVEVFCGGRSLSFRLPKPDRPGEVRRFGWFVEDGTVSLIDIMLRDCDRRVERGNKTRE